MLDLKEEISKGNIEVYCKGLSEKEIGGISPKRLVRVHKSLFGNLWADIFHKKTSAYTYLNDKITDDNTPDYVTCILKNVRQDGFEPIERVYNELATMNMAEHFKIPFAYSMPIKKGNELYLISVNMIPENYEVSSFFEYVEDDSLNLFSPIEQYEKLVFNRFFKDMKNVSAADKFDCVNKKIEMLLKQLFFKKYIMGDSDAGGHNIGILTSENDVVVSPIFDNEQSFSSRINKDALEKDIEYLSKRHPNVLKEILKTSNALIKDNFKKIKTVVNSVVDSPKLANQMIIFIVQNLTNINVACALVADSHNEMF